jgi:flagellar protein FlbD
VLQLTRLGGPVFALNPDLIERAEATPDTVVTLVNGSHYVIRESLEQLTELIAEYRASVIAHAQRLGDIGRPAAGPASNATGPGAALPGATVVRLHRGEH